MPVSSLLILAAWLMPATSARSDVVVVARKLKDWRAVLVVDKGDVARCRIVRSTGDGALDAKGCLAMQQCFAATRPQFAAAEQKGLPAGTRRHLFADANRALALCFTDAHRRIALEATAPPVPAEAADDRR